MPKAAVAKQLGNLASQLSCVCLQLRHESLTERSAKLAARQAQIAALKEKLMFFRDLPPDIDAAHQLYNTKFSQMEAAAKQFEDGLAQL